MKNNSEGVFKGVIMFKNKSNKILFIIAVSMISVSTVTGYVMAKTSASPLKEEEQVKISSNCEVTHVYNYTTCGESEQSVVMADSTQIGLTKSEFADTIPDGRVTDFSEDKVTVTHDIRQYCHKHYILIYEGDTLYIKANKNNDEKLETEVVLGKLKGTIKISKLNRLKDGMVFSTLNEAKRYAVDGLYD